MRKVVGYDEHRRPIWQDLGPSYAYIAKGSRDIRGGPIDSGESPRDRELRIHREHARRTRQERAP